MVWRVSLCAVLVLKRLSPLGIGRSEPRPLWASHAYLPGWRGMGVTDLKPVKSAQVYLKIASPGYREGTALWSAMMSLGDLANPRCWKSLCHCRGQSAGNYCMSSFGIEMRNTAQRVWIRNNAVTCQREMRCGK